MKRGRVYNPTLVEENRRRAKLGEPPLIKPLEVYSRIEYSCRRCKVRYMGNEEHRCADRSAP